MERLVPNCDMSNRILVRIVLLKYGLAKWLVIRTLVYMIWNYLKTHEVYHHKQSNLSYVFLWERAQPCKKSKTFRANQPVDLHELESFGFRLWFWSLDFYFELWTLIFDFEVGIWTIKWTLMLDFGTLNFFFDSMTVFTKSEK